MWVCTNTFVTCGVSKSVLGHVAVDCLHLRLSAGGSAHAENGSLHVQQNYAPSHARKSSGAIFKAVRPFTWHMTNSTDQLASQEKHVDTCHSGSEHSAATLQWHFSFGRTNVQLQCWKLHAPTTWPCNTCQKQSTPAPNHGAHHLRYWQYGRRQLTDTTLAMQA